MVIKVKYGDSLRRFNARVDENEKLALDMAGLRAKILSLFSFPPDAEPTLTYIDEDGDVVTLVDDDDLHDVMRQNLKFLRIDVQLINDNGGKSYARSSGSSTPLRSPQVQHPLPNINAAVAEVFKSVPEPLREALSKLSFDFASKAAISSPVLAELVDRFAKGEQSSNLDSQSQVGADSSIKNNTGGSNASNGGDTVKLTVDSALKNSSDVGTGNVSRGVGVPVISLPASVDLNLPPSDTNPSSSTALHFAPVALKNVIAGDFRKEVKKDSKGPVGLKSVGFGASTSSSVPPIRPTQTNNIFSIPYGDCPFTGTAIANDSSVPSYVYQPSQPFKRSHGHAASMGGMFHKGVQCDGCGVHPIIGPRYKSKVKEDYDLCSICFSEMGNDTDYIRIDRPVRMDRPVSCRNPRSCIQMNAPWVAPVLPHHLSRGFGAKLGRPKLDSRFILDVNVMDGTTMAPSTSFTKIWRMRNNGSLLWPQGTQLVWIGGDRFSDAVSLDLEIPADGVFMDKELDIAVDFTAPASPGRYCSYWRMASPSGQKFGQRIWVLIQVDASLDESLCDTLEGLNLNLPPVNSGSNGPEIIDVNVQPTMDGEFFESSNSKATTEPGKKVVDEQPKKDHELFPINDTLLVGQGVSAPTTTGPQSAVSYPIIDLSEVVLPAPAQAPSHSPSAPTYVQNPIPVLPTEVQSTVAHASTSAVPKNPVEETLLKELEEMGFKQVDLNKEVLRMNEYDFEQSVDDLCGVSEWDPILEELQEMGFNDKEKNKKLLVKNNGSIKRVVMDLITGEKA